MKNQKAFLRFREMLETRKFTHDPNRDIRQHVLSLVSRKVGIGYVSSNFTAGFGANLNNLFDRPIPADDEEIERCQAYFATGTLYADEKKSHPGARRIFNDAPVTAEIILFESGFLATTHSWVHSFKEKNQNYACLGFVYDDIAHYFMADYPNRLIHKLNSSEDLPQEEYDRAEALLRRIVSQRISKYNAQPMQAPAMTSGFKRRVLVCDQAYADASTIYGKVGKVEFEKMLLSAISENPDAEILVKSHPDTYWEKKKRTGYYTHLNSGGRVRILRDPINPYTLFDLVDTVYVGTSQMGLEALFAGKKVVTFGAPFYAGWGLTDDRQHIAHRKRQRSLVEVFHYFYIWYTIYHLPNRRGPAEIEDVLSFIEQNRPSQLPLSQEELESPTKVSVIIPVHGVEAYIKTCIASIQSQTLREIEIITVNDASPDGSQLVIDRLAAEDPRIRPIILPRNVKQGMARNKGIEAARGTYVWLLDGDDWLANKQFLQTLYEGAEAEGLDMARARKSHEAVFDETGKLLKERADKTETYFSEEIRRTTFAETPALLFNRHCWTWLYRRDFLNRNQIRFVTPQWEERAFLLRALVKAKAIGLFPVDGPAYRIRLESTARRQRGRSDFEMMLANFHATFDSFLEEGAAAKDHPLRRHLNFQISQFIEHMLRANAPYRYYRDQGEVAEIAFLDELRKELARCGFRPRSFDSSLHKLSREHLDAGAYPLIAAGLLSRRYDLVRRAIDLEPIPQATLYEVLLAEPTEEATVDLQEAVSHYARNNMVQTAASGGPSLRGDRPRIVIHIGSTKTGSTFLQHMLDKNRPALLRQGIWVPEVGLFWQPGRPHKQAGHSQFTQSAIHKDLGLRNHLERGLDLMDGRIHTIVLSSEAFFLQEKSLALVDYFSDFLIEMVVYLRRQDEWANSQYCEFVAGGAVGRVDIPIDEWLKGEKTRKWLDYLTLVEAWSRKLGASNVHVRLFDKNEFEGGDLLTDFAATTGLPQLMEMARPNGRHMNDAQLSSGHVELIRLFNTRPFENRNSYFSFIEEASQSLSNWRSNKGLPKPKPWMLSTAQADAIMSEAAASNAILSQEYLGRTGGSPFGDRSEIPDQTQIYSEELALVDRIYRRYASKSKPKSDSVSVSKKSAVRSKKYRILNYGFFGWRLWFLTPVVSRIYSRYVDVETVRNFNTEPVDFANQNWTGRKSILRYVLYPQGNVMGPGGILRLWIPVGRKLIRKRPRAPARDAFTQNPIQVARRSRKRIPRLIGRLMFPLGELR